MSKAKRWINAIIEMLANKGPLGHETYGWFEVLRWGPFMWVHGEDGGTDTVVEHWEFGLFDWCVYWSEDRQEFAT